MSAMRGDFKIMGEPPLTEEVARLLREACCTLDRDAPSARRNIHQALELLAGAPLQTEIPPGEPLRARRALAPWQARRVSDHIDANLEAPIRIEEMAGITRLSTSYFFRAFKGSFGMPPYAYVIVRRLVRARELLAGSDEPLSHVAMACGFNDQAHFSRVFHREVGRPPGVWRREERGLVV